MKTFLCAFLILANSSVFALDYSASSERIQSDDPSITDLAEEITRNKRSDLDKSRAIHAWVTANISFDQGRAQTIESGQTVSYVQDAVTVLQTKIGVCEGYSNLTAALHRAIGIPAKVSIGKYYYFPYRLYPMLKRINRIPNVNDVQNLHGWNEVKINGKWIPMDTTSDSGSSSGGAWSRNLQEEFFNPDLEYFNATHLKTGEMNQ